MTTKRGKEPTPTSLGAVTFLWICIVLMLLVGNLGIAILLFILFIWLDPIT